MAHKGLGPQSAKSVQMSCSGGLEATSGAQSGP